MVQHLLPNSNFSLSLLLRMLFFLVSCISFILISHSFLKPNPSPKIQNKMWNSYETFHRFYALFFTNKIGVSIRAIQFPFSTAKYGIKRDKKGDSFSLLDLPDLALDTILEKLLPAELCSMAMVCRCLRDRCRSDHLWEKHFRKKWGGVIGDAAFKQWLLQIGSREDNDDPKFLNWRRKLWSKFQFLEFFGYYCRLEDEKMKRNGDAKWCLDVDSVMSCYLALESGKFWFPAQVFNRERGHIGFMLSCYDAQLCYDSTTDNFIARFPAQGRSMIEEGVEWNRLRAPSIDTPANVLHLSDCLHDLKPDDHIEIQWRKNKHFPYGWWYGVVGHLQSCGGDSFNCQCYINDKVIVEFKQYSPRSRWRRTTIDRKDHREVGNEADGFYGGVRKLYKKEEIAEWTHFWQNLTLE